MDDPSAGDGIVTTDNEIAGLRIIQAIAGRHVDPKRVVIRDSKCYCAILLDDNNRKSGKHPVGAASDYERARSASISSM